MSFFWQKIRKDFPITKKFIYLDHAAGGPIPVPVFSRVKQYYQENIQASDFAWGKWVKRREEARRTVAKFINADPEEVTFIGSTSQGMNYAAEMLAGEGPVLTNTSEFPASTLPWLWRSAQLVWQKPRDAKIDLPSFKILLSPGIKTIISSYVQYGTGFRQDLEAIGRLKGKRYLVVNATQGFGALALDVKKWNADFLCTNSYKWLMAGYGGGVFYIRKELLSRLRPGTVGWRSMRVPELMDNQKLDLHPHAMRYELGCPPFPAIFGVAAACEYQMKIGLQKIEKRILELTDFAIQKLQEKGFEILSPLEKKHRSGIVVFKVKDPAKVWKELLAKKIYVSPRSGGIRIAPHFYNSMEEIERFVKLLDIGHRT